MLAELKGHHFETLLNKTASHTLTQVELEISKCCLSEVQNGQPPQGSSVIRDEFHIHIPHGTFQVRFFALMNHTIVVGGG